MPQRSRAFVTAISASLCGLAGLLLGGYGVDLVRLRRPDFEYGTLLATAIVGGLGWCAGAVVAWRLASARPLASRADVALLFLGAVVVFWFGIPIARSLRYAANLGRGVARSIRARFDSLSIRRQSSTQAGWAQAAGAPGRRDVST